MWTGIDKAKIISKCFHPNSEWLACSSDKGTQCMSTQLQKENPKSLLNFMKPILPKYYNAEYSYRQYRVKGPRNVNGFVEGLLAIVNIEDGTYYLVDYTNGQSRHCVLIESDSLFELSKVLHQRLNLFNFSKI